MSGPRLRYHFHPTEPLRLGQVRVALIGTLWVRSMGGKLVASNENRAALEDLEWLGIEPDAMVSRPKSEAYEEAMAELVKSGNAYPCFCGTSEAREMSVQPGGWPEERRYDSRCRSLSPADKKALKRSRNPSVRLRPQEDLPVIQLHRKDVPSQQPDFDFLLSLPDKIPNQFMARVINDERARCTHSVVSTEELINLSLHAHLSRSLDLTLPEYLFLESWDCEAAETPVHQLRSDGYLPGALLHALARTCWRPDPSMDLDQMAEVFSLETLETQEDSPTTKEHLRAINGQKIGAMEQNHLVQELVAHLTRRGYPIAERNRAWQERFTLSVQSDLMTLGDTEEIASHLLQDSAEFDRSSLRRLQRDELSTLLQSFESLMEELGEESPQTWRRLIHKFRQQVPSPGRALSHIRVVMTGQPRGPSLASVLWLLGIEECRARISKARSLHC